MADFFSRRRSLEFIYDENVDWCEPNYQYHPHIGEWFNTISIWPSFIQWTFLLINFLHFRKYIETRWFFLLFTYYLNSAFGSFAHATLWHISGVIDEFFLAFVGITILFNMLVVFKDDLKWFHIVPIPIFMILFFGISMKIPIAGYIITMFLAACTVFGSWIFLGIKRVNQYHCIEIPHFYQMLIWTILFGHILAGAFAISDELFCEWIEYSVFHSLWHILFQISAHVFIILMILTRTVYTKNNRFIETNPYFPFYIRAKRNHSELELEKYTTNSNTNITKDTTADNRAETAVNP